MVLASKVPCYFQAGIAVSLANLPSNSSRGSVVRRKDLLKPDLMSEIILLGFGTVIFVILILILIAAWTQAPALV